MTWRLPLPGPSASDAVASRSTASPEPDSASADPVGEQAGRAQTQQGGVEPGRTRTEGRRAGRRSASGGVVPTHPVTTPDPAVLRWVIPDGLLAFVGPVARAPRMLQTLLDEGVLTGLVLEAGAVLTALAPGHTWAEDGPAVRAALVDALGVPASWEAAAGAHDLGPDDVLKAAARQVLDEQVGVVAAEHGGTVELCQVRHGIVEVRLGGACDGCLAAAMTLRVRFERLLRRRCPWLVEVREAD